MDINPQFYRTAIRKNSEFKKILFETHQLEVQVYVISELWQCMIGASMTLYWKNFKLTFFFFELQKFCLHILQFSLVYIFFKKNLEKFAQNLNLKVFLLLYRLPCGEIISL